MPLFFCPCPLSSSLLLSLPVPLSLRACLFSRSFSSRETLYRLSSSSLPASVDESNAAMCIARLFQAFEALFSSLLSMAVTSTSSLRPSPSLIRFLPIGRFGFQDVRKYEVHKIHSEIQSAEMIHTCKFYTIYNNHAEYSEMDS